MASVSALAGQTAEMGLQALGQRRIGGVGRRGVIHNDVVGRCQRVAVLAEILSCDAFDAIALNRVAGMALADR